MRWLVISDIHFMNPGYDTAKLRSSLRETLKGLEKQLDFVLITGDCFYRYDDSGDTVPEMAAFIKEIGKACRVKPKRIFICRGNHDVDRSNKERNALIEECRKDGVIWPDKVDQLTSCGGEKFRTLYALVKGTSARYKPFTPQTPRGLGARIINIDTCLLSKDDEDYGKLCVRVPELDRMKGSIKNDGRLNIVMMHHGIEWLNPNDARSFEHWLDDNHVDIVFCGHTHRAEVGHLNDVRRDILQFTSGAIFIDQYAIPSFYLCEGDANAITLSLYTYSKQTEDWELDGHSLRKFRRGKYRYAPSRMARNDDGHNEVVVADSSTSTPNTNGSNNRPSKLTLNRLACEEVIQTLNQRYANKYGPKIVSSKTEKEESFNAWKIVGSLAGVGIPYPIAMMLTCDVVDEIVSDRYSGDNALTSTQIRRHIYNEILRCESYPEGTSGFDVGLWASEYARHYDKDTGFVVVDGTRSEQLSYSLLKSSLIKEAVVSVTGESVYYDKAYSSEKTAMANSVMRFVKSLGIFEIKREVLLSLISEYMTERPHPWFVTKDRESLVAYHRERANEHLLAINSEGPRVRPVHQVEASYHVCAAILAWYDEYTGCREVSPVTILHHALKRIDQKDDKGLPMLRYRLVQLQKDLERGGFSIDELSTNVELVYRNIVLEKSVDRSETTNALEAMSRMLDALGPRAEGWRPPASLNDVEGTFASAVELFEGAEGFSVKAPLRYFDQHAFFVSPHWTLETRRSFRLGESLLVCMVGDDPYTDFAMEGNASHGSDAARQTLDPAFGNSLAEYLSIQNKYAVREVVFFKDNMHEFSPDERKTIRSFLKEKGIEVLCVFIQERNFKFVPENGWRRELLQVMMASRYSS